MNTETGEILPELDLKRRLAQMSKPERRQEKKKWMRLDPAEAEMLQKMTMAERIAFKVRGRHIPHAEA